MTNCDCQKNIEDEASITTATADKGLITLEDGLLLTTVTSTTSVTFFDQRPLGVGPQDALLTSRSLVYFMFLPAIF